jgi:hypothetical protein
MGIVGFCYSRLFDQVCSDVSYFQGYSDSSSSEVFCPFDFPENMEYDQESELRTHF